MPVEFVAPREPLVASIAEDMRLSDAEEVWASHHHTPAEALRFGWGLSDYASIAVYDSAPLAMLGLIRGDLLSGTGVVWMLASNASLRYPREFLTQTGPVIKEMLSVCPRLCNYVHQRNVKSVVWLKRLGFTIEPAIQYGVDSEQFHPFHIERYH